MMSMSKLADLEEYYLSLKRNNQLDLNKVLLNIESSIHDLDERLSKVEVELQDLKVKFTINHLDYHGLFTYAWEKRRNETPCGQDI